MLRDASLTRREGIREQEACGYNPAVGASGDRERVAADLRRIREAVRERALLDGDKASAATVAPEPPERPAAEATTTESPSEPGPTPLRPDGGAVNASWDVSKAPSGGLLGRIARRVLTPFVDAQAAWNAQQVRLDNAIVDYIDARLDATHRHYDRVLGIHGRHMQDVNERHLILQEELVAHVHDLIKRIDLVLGESERGRLSLEFALRDVRRRLALLEERLGPG